MTKPKMEAAPRKRTRKAALLAEREAMLMNMRASLKGSKTLTSMQDVETTQSLLSFVSLLLIEWIYPERE